MANQAPEITAKIAPYLFTYGTGANRKRYTVLLNEVETHVSTFMPDYCIRITAQKDKDKEDKEDKPTFTLTSYPGLTFKEYNYPVQAFKKNRSKKSKGKKKSKRKGYKKINKSN